MKKIVVVEDDELTREELAVLLRNSGYRVVLLDDFENLKNQLEKSGADLILLDINIPVLNGTTVLREVRRTSNTPVIMVTSRDGEADANDLRYGDLILDLAKGRIRRAGKEVDLSKNEMMILSYLVEHKGEMVKRSDLMILLWNNSEYINDNALTVNVGRLRAKLKELGCEDAIETKKKYGYILR